MAASAAPAAAAKHWRIYHLKAACSPQAAFCMLRHFRRDGHLQRRWQFITAYQAGRAARSRDIPSGGVTAQAQGPGDFGTALTFDFDHGDSLSLPASMPAIYTTGIL
jgi:hypothetical protein